ncbi:Putative aminopeptidase ysdC [Mycoplasmopsis maculosa]|uniref:Aminopeptidase ysdC n=1 Tax=Mycoplasmopsis maculosa TaxID=114885 RepID=A0A449B3C4_9BACT|nr:M42 family metallopeptidase [Mycoplasmopsis maculosa]VEU75103.1 Putative aminopeptidase ysdC [Mycoplasmopsis maculosa]
MSALNDIKKKLKRYMEIDAISGYEEPVVTELKNNINSTNFTFSRDGFGSLIIENKNEDKEAPKIMIAAHMDEIGYLVRTIEENGNILVSPVGGIWPAAIIGTKAKLITNKEQKELYGIFGHTSIHILEASKRDKVPTNKEVFVDFGFNSKQEALDFGVDVGDRIYISGEYLELKNNLVGGKAMDNRAGVTVIDMLANKIQNLQLPNKTYIVGSVQEEVGSRGAKTSVSIINPDVAFAIDTGASHDTYGAIKGVPTLGKGVALLIQDGGIITDYKLVDYLVNLAKKHNIPAYKYIAEGGSTDGAVLQYGKGGVPTITLSIPQRYLHSPIGVCSLVDIEAAFNLITEFVKVFDKFELKKLKK